MQLPTSEWQAAVKAILTTALPDDALLVAFHQSRGSESLYASVLIAERLYDFRFAYHPVQQPAASLHVLDLRQFESDRALRRALTVILRQRRTGWPLTYGDFVLLSLVEKLNQEGGLFMIANQPVAQEVPVTPALAAALADGHAHSWLLTRFKTGQVVLTHTGRAVLDHYWQVAEVNIDEPVWDHNPRIASPQELADYFSRRS